MLLDDPVAECCPSSTKRHMEIPHKMCQRNIKIPSNKPVAAQWQALLHSRVDSPTFKKMPSTCRCKNTRLSVYTRHQFIRARDHHLQPLPSTQGTTPLWNVLLPIKVTPLPRQTCRWASLFSKNAGTPRPSSLLALLRCVLGILFGNPRITMRD